MSNTLFPVFLKTETARFLIVGGGNIGLEKTETLLKQNPAINITVIATQIFPVLKELLLRHPHIHYYERPFEEQDLDTTDFVIAATNNKEINAEIKHLANARKILVNAADQPALCDFYLGSIVNKGSLKIAISTNGKSPVLARRMREHLEEAIPDDINQSIDSLNAFRNHHKGSFQEKIADLNAITKNLSNNNIIKQGRQYKHLALKIVVLVIVFFIGYGVSVILN